MPDRRTGFLQTNERAYIEKSNIATSPWDYTNVKSGGKQAHWRIQHEVATVPGLQTVLMRFFTDLNAVQSFQRADAETWRKWESRTLPAVTRELELIRDIVTQMIEIAEDDRSKTEKEELRDARDSLYPDDFHPDDVIPAGGAKNYESFDAQHKWTGDELATHYEVIRTRFDGLETLLKKDELVGILDYVAENGPCELPARRISGSGEWWAKVATQYLSPDLAQKTEHSNTRRTYEITPNGTAVLNCWNQLRETTAVAMAADANPDGSDREHIATALDLHDLRKRPYQ